MRVAAVVVNHDGADDLPACLRALSAQTRPVEHVVVVDNASTDGSAAVVEGLGLEGVRLLANATNRGFAGGANDGIAAVGDVDAILVLNPDAVLAPDHLEHAVAALGSDPRRGAVQGRLHRRVERPDGLAVIDTTGHEAFRTRLFRNRGEGEVDRGQWARPGEVFGVSGAAALYRRAMLEDVAVELPGRPRPEVFDEDLFAFWEDVDLDWRAAMRGWVCWYEPRAVARHERGGAGPRRTVLVEHLNFRNRLLLLAKNDTWRSLLPALPSVLLTTLLKAAELLLTNPRALRGLGEALRAMRRILRKRPAVHGRATIPSPAVVDHWFGPFDYLRWIRTWWHRVRRHEVGHDP